MIFTEQTAPYIILKMYTSFEGTTTYTVPAQTRTTILGVESLPQQAKTPPPPKVTHLVLIP